MYSEFMANIQSLQYVKPFIPVTAKAVVHAPNEKVIQFKGRPCSKSDIEDLIKKLWKPTEPDPDRCCGQYCEPCIFDTYDRQLGIYLSKKEEMQSLLLEFEEAA